MKLYPLVLFSTLRNNSGELSYSDFDEDNGIPFTGIYAFDAIPNGATQLDTVWFDFYTHRLYHCLYSLEKFCHLIAEHTYIDISYTLGGVIKSWLVTPPKSLLMEPLNLESLDEINLMEMCPIDWNIKRKELQRQFDEHVTDELIGRIELMKSYMDIITVQYTYKYEVYFEYWNDEGEYWELNPKKEFAAQLSFIEESLMDGTHDKLHDGGLREYHQAGIPNKMAIKWTVGNSEYTAYYWYEEMPTRMLFKELCHENLDANVDFILRIDTEQYKYETSLYRHDTDELYILSDEAYQLIVFRDGFEEYRSANYNQERGAWIW